VEELFNTPREILKFGDGITLVPFGENSNLYRYAGNPVGPWSYFNCMASPIERFNCVGCVSLLVEQGRSIVHKLRTELQTRCVSLHARASAAREQSSAHRGNRIIPLKVLTMSLIIAFVSNAILRLVPILKDANEVENAPFVSSVCSAQKKQKQGAHGMHAQK